MIVAWRDLEVVAGKFSYIKVVSDFSESPRVISHYRFGNIVEAFLHLGCHLVVFDGLLK